MSVNIVHVIVYINRFFSQWCIVFHCVDKPQCNCPVAYEHWVASGLGLYDKTTMNIFDTSFGHNKP
jgi:hypothetical protein